MDDLQKRFVLWEAHSRDTIDFKRCYCEICNDLVSGLLLSQIIFWFLPNRKGESKLRIIKNGRLWLCRARGDWFEECFITDHQFDRASKILVEKGFIYKANYKFDGTPKPHVSVRFDNLVKALSELNQKKGNVYDQSLGLGVLQAEVPPRKSEYKMSANAKILYKKSKQFYDSKNMSSSMNITSIKKLKEFIFEHFWISYGNGIRKPSAKREFLKLSLKEIEKLMVHHIKYRDYTKPVKLQFAPARYIKDKVFNDDVELYNYNKDKKTKTNDQEDYFGGFIQ